MTTTSDVDGGVEKKFRRNFPSSQLFCGCKKSLEEGIVGTCEATASRMMPFKNGRKEGKNVDSSDFALDDFFD